MSDFVIKRVEKFKQLKNKRKKYIFSFILFVFLLVGGICCTDYSISSLMYNKNNIQIFSFSKLDNYIIEIDFFDKKLYFTSFYIERDYQNLKKRLEIY